MAYTCKLRKAVWSKVLSLRLVIFLVLLSYLQQVLLSKWEQYTAEYCRQIQTFSRRLSKATGETYLM